MPLLHSREAALLKKGERHKLGSLGVARRGGGRRAREERLGVLHFRDGSRGLDNL